MRGDTHDRRNRMQARAMRLQRAMRIGDSIKLRLLADELRTIRFGPETTHR